MRLATELPTFDVQVHADRKAFRQILYNLLSNAIKFTPGGGQIITRLALDGDQVILEVTDNGVGMSQDDAKRVGTPYQQADSAAQSEARGTGLGLALVKALAEMHDGTFSLDSELGQGTTIRLTVPILDTDKMDQAKVQELDVRSHIRRAQQATTEIAAVAARLSS
ncbi:hypothetical protein MNBD_ALPHA06-1129 [hydrothermal vent metagenome]|uniref:histidine kinase n=1 Tax=hydrothermal vent metagenome TaxID=652676 RepID=A0A3B0SAC9_9ZZZZ